MEQRPVTAQIIGAFPLPKRPVNRSDRAPRNGIVAEIDPVRGRRIAARLAALGGKSDDAAN